MGTMTGKKIIVAVTGSIAAYKSLLLVRLLKKAGCEVKVIMSPAACHFVAPLSFATLSENEVLVDFFKDDTWNNHVSLGIWADYMIVAPASANTIAKAANGISDNMLLATYLSAKCPVVFCPAMDLDMYKHPSTIHNLKRLQSFGNQIIHAKYGELASGLVGEGRLAEPEEIFEYIQYTIAASDELKGKKFLITAGPTYEAIDPVRFIGNHSSGKMGLAIAETIANKGGLVELVIGPNQLDIQHQGINVTNCTSAEEMYAACQKVHASVDVSIFAAAVADYRPSEVATQKIKKSDSELHLTLVKNVDIAYQLGQQKRNDQIHVGFALETENEEANGQKKLQKKNFDFLVLNSLNDPGAGFKHDTNKIKIIESNGKVNDFELKSKNDVAKDIVEFLISHLLEK
ncbi:MAG: bifunctional phosphopantothenoylcysteine decarboxylase/phosphopantothenate--cysteine ligase CoaBC [Saprospiraceae bacterium]|nr:bifunctional phosphopantothenoylcysteine decarboxylase/phosphopantothenate--cysteine ligase CoaBC [Saprospiraceae bacterium]